MTVTPIPLDLTAPGAARALVAELDERGIEIRTLVNNAGVGTYGPFAGEDLDRITTEITLNVLALTQVTRLLWPQLLAAGNGVLINVASTAAYQPAPYIAVYAATKAYVRSFGEALWYEARGTGTRVLTLAPGPARTEFFEAAGSDAFVVGQELGIGQVIDIALRALDRRVPPLSVVTGWRNAFAARLAAFVPRRALVMIAGRAMRPGPEAPTEPVDEAPSATGQP